MLKRNTGMSHDEACAIVNYLNSQKFKEHPQYGKETIHIRRNRQTPPLKCSLVIDEQGNALVLLKGKEGLLKERLLRKHGHFKSFKAALDFQTGVIVAHATVDVTALARRNIEEACKTLPDDKKMALFEKEKHRIICQIKTECGFTDIYSKLKTSHFCQYESIPTQQKNAALRKSEGKAIRNPGDVHTILSFSTPLAEGNLLELKSHFTQNPNLLLTGFQDLTHQLIALHNKNLVHRDIKIENILVMKLRLHLADFGLCSEVEAARNNHLGSYVLTAPEVHDALLNEGKYYTPDPIKADIYALGLLCFYLLTGVYTPLSKEMYKESELNKEEFELLKESYSEYIQSKLHSFGYSEDLIAIISKMMSLDPKNRPTAKEVEGMLKTVTLEKVNLVLTNDKDDNSYPTMFSFD